jgi:hypothetical protein
MNQSQRPRFFEGQYLGAADLSATVDYGRVQNARHTLAAHIWGIAVGLDLIERPLSSGDIDVTIAPGIAWDGYARSVVVLAPAKLTAERFANFQADTPPEGLLVKVWLRYDETATNGPKAGFQTCRVDDQNARIGESFAIEVGNPANGPHGTLSIASRTVDAIKARLTFNPNAPDVYDESVPYQAFPDGKLPQWLIPIGYVRWQKLAGQAGRVIARNDKATPPDSDLIRGFRRYIGAIVDTVNAADGVIRMRDRWIDPDPSKTFFHTPRATIDKNNPPVNDLVWIEGNLRVMGDARVAGGKLEFRDQTGSDGKVPLALRRVDPNPQGGKDLQVLIGAESSPSGTHALAIGPVKLDATTGALGEMSKRVVVRDNGNVGIATEMPTQLLTFGGDKKTRLEMGKISGSFPWGTNAPGKAGDGSFAVNQQSKGSDNPGADFALMRDQKLRVILLDANTQISSQSDGNVIFSVNAGEPGDTEVARVTAAGRVGIGTTTPAVPLDVAGRIMRQGLNFSETGTATNDDVITVPWGSRDDWNIFVSPRSMGQEEPSAEFDNAMLMFECFAFNEPSTSNKWHVRCRYKFKFQNADGSGNGQWFAGQANWLMVPR